MDGVHYHFTEKEKILKEISEGETSAPRPSAACGRSAHSFAAQRRDACVWNGEASEGESEPPPCQNGQAGKEARQQGARDPSQAPAASAIRAGRTRLRAHVAGITATGRPKAILNPVDGCPPHLPELSGKFLEHAEVHGNVYGTSFAALEAVKSQGKICILDIDVQVRSSGRCRLGKRSGGGRLGARRQTPLR